MDGRRRPRDWKFNFRYQANFIHNQAWGTFQPPMVKLPCRWLLFPVNHRWSIRIRPVSLSSVSSRVSRIWPSPGWASVKKARSGFTKRSVLIDFACICVLCYEYKSIMNFCTGQFLEQTMVHAHFLICYRAFVQYRRRDDICHDRGNQRGHDARKHSKGEVNFAF